MDAPPNDATNARPRYRPTYHRASSQRSAALAKDILRRLKSIEDPDLEAPREREPDMSPDLERLPPHAPGLWRYKEQLLRERHWPAVSAI